MNKNLLYMIIGFIIGILVGGIAGYFISNLIRPQGFRNFQIDSQTQQQVTQFFESTSDTNQIKDYCNNNRQNCFYYCRQINPQNPACSIVANFSRGPGNYSRNGGQRNG